MPELGYWLIYLQQPAGTASVLLGALAVFLAFSVANDAARDQGARTGSEPADDRDTADLQPA